jgi:hypothetical protein
MFQLETLQTSTNKSLQKVKDMSNAVLAQSATQLTVSNHGEESYPFNEVAKKLAVKAIKGATRESFTLNRGKLISSVVNDYKARFAAIYNPKEHLPSAVFQKIEDAVDLIIKEQLERVSTKNAVSWRRSFSHKAAQQSIVDRITIIGENTLPLDEQHLGVNILISDVNRKIEDFMNGKLPGATEDTLIQMRKRLMSLEGTKKHIEESMKAIQSITQPE